jgi:hypothetical protein
MLIRHHFAELIYVLPNVLVLRMKNVWPIGVNHYPGCVTSRKAVARDMISGVEYNYRMAGFGQFASHNSPRKPGPNYGKSH